MGSKEQPKAEFLEFTPARQVIADYLTEGAKKHTVSGLFEVDVTLARQLIKQYKESKGESLSFTAFLISCFAKSVGNNKFMHAHRLGKNKLIVFDDVDVAMIVEREIEGKKVPSPYTIRAANKKTFLEIHQEIRKTQSINLEKKDQSLDKKSNANLINILAKLPGFLRRWIIHQAIKNPYNKKKMNGTVGITAVGMFAGGMTGWAVPITPHNLVLVVGGIKTRPEYINGKVEPREMLSLTLAMDHDIADGAPATRFLVELVHCIEAAYGLTDIVK